MSCHWTHRKVYYSNLLLFSCKFMSNSLWPHGLQHNKLVNPLLSLGFCTNSCPLNWLCHLTISSFAAPFSFFLQSAPNSGPFSMSWHFVSGSQCIGALASASVLLVNIQGWFPIGLFGLMSLPSEGLSGVLSSTTIWKHQFFRAQSSL